MLFKTLLVFLCMRVHVSNKVLFLRFSNFVFLRDHISIVSRTEFNLDGEPRFSG